MAGIPTYKLACGPYQIHALAVQPKLWDVKLLREAQDGSGALDIVATRLMFRGLVPRTRDNAPPLETAADFAALVLYRAAADRDLRKEVAERAIREQPNARDVRPGSWVLRVVSVPAGTVQPGPDKPWRLGTATEGVVVVASPQPGDEVERKIRLRPAPEVHAEPPVETKRRKGRSGGRRGKESGWED